MWSRRCICILRGISGPLGARFGADVAVDLLGVDCEAFWVPPGLDLELMAHLGLQGSILKHFRCLQARFGAHGAFVPSGLDFEAFWVPPGLDWSSWRIWPSRGRF